MQKYTLASFSIWCTANAKDIISKMNQKLDEGYVIPKTKVKQNLLTLVKDYF